jgi:SAM-dependent methyltransferase
MLKPHTPWTLGLPLTIALVVFWSAGHPQVQKPDVEYVPTPEHVVAAMLEMAETRSTDVVYDLGCGDGRVVIAAAKDYGARGLGVDIDPERIAESRANAQAAGVADRVRFVQQDLFEMDIREATVVTLYLLPQLNRKLRPKLLSDLRPGTRVLSHDFDMGEWQPDNVRRLPGLAYEHTVYYWVVPADVGGIWRIHLPASAPEGSYRLRLQQQFQEVGGTMMHGGREAPLTRATLTGDHLRFTLATAVQGQEVEMSFDGRAASDIMHGSVEVRGGPTAGRHDWTGVREVAGAPLAAPR